MADKPPETLDDEFPEPSHEEDVVEEADLVAPMPPPSSDFVPVYDLPPVPEISPIDLTSPAKPPNDESHITSNGTPLKTVDVSSTGLLAALEDGVPADDARSVTPVSVDTTFSNRDEQRMHEEILSPMATVEGSALKLPLTRTATLKNVSQSQINPPAPDAALKAPGLGPVKDTFEWIDEDVDEKNDIDWTTRETRCTRLMTNLRDKSPGNLALVMAVIGTIILITPGIIDLIFFIENPVSWWTNMRAKVNDAGEPLMSLGGYPVIYWSIWSVITWDVFWLVWFTVPYFPYISLRIHFALTGYVSEVWQDNVVQFVRVTKVWTIIFITALSSLLCFRSGFRTPVDISATMSSFLTISVINSAIWTLAKISMARFARSFQRRVYGERREKVRFEQFVLERLYTAVEKVKALQEESAKSLKIPSANGNGSTPSNVAPDPNNLTIASSSFAAPAGSFEAKPIEDTTIKPKETLARIQDPLMALNPPRFKFKTLTDAKILARDLYSSLLRLQTEELMAHPEMPQPTFSPDGTPHLLFSTFAPYFGDPRLTTKAFSLFDLNQDNMVGRVDMKDAVVQICEDKLALDKSIQNAWQALDKLDNFFGNLLLFVTILLYLSIFLNVAVWIAALASFWAGAMFAFQNSIKNLIESIIFLFITHPFDIGDRITTQGTSYFIKEMTLMSSTFTHTDGREVYLSNPVLSQQFIYNIRRSGAQVETIRMQVDVTTTGDQLARLGTALNAAIKEKYFREFLPNIECFIEFIRFEKRSMQVQLFVTHRNNFQNGGPRWRRTTQFLTLLKEKLAECEIKAGKMKVVEVNGVSQYYLSKTTGKGADSPTGTLPGAPAATMGAQRTRPMTPPSNVLV